MPYGPKRQTQYIIGYGVGRCGTMSLAHLLNLQPDSDVDHESNDLHWWPVVADYPKTRDELKKRGRHNKFVGNIGYMWMQYIPRVNEDFPNVKFIHIWRKKSEVIESFWKRNQDRFNAGFARIGGKRLKVWSMPNLWYSQYPFLGHPPSKDLIARTYETYFHMAAMAAYKYPKRIFKLHMTDLNKPDSIRELLSYIGIPPQDQVVEPTWINEGGQAIVKYRSVPQEGHLNIKNAG